jgi:hypothetical protein
MIHYQVRCSRDHEFDGWFKDSAAFDRQSRRGLVECPVCGDTKVGRALMAPAVSTRRAAADPLPAPASSEAPAVANGASAGTFPGNPPGTSVGTAPGASAGMTTGGRMPAQMRAMLQRMRSEIERNCDYVGPRFAEEARKIHNGESERRGIYGEATPEQTEALADDGIEIGNIPWIPLADG